MITLKKRGIETCDVLSNITVGSVILSFKGERTWNWLDALSEINHSLDRKFSYGKMLHSEIIILSQVNLIALTDTNVLHEKSRNMISYIFQLNCKVNAAN